SNGSTHRWPSWQDSTQLTLNSDQNPGVARLATGRSPCVIFRRVLSVSRSEGRTTARGYTCRRAMQSFRPQADSRYLTRSRLLDQLPDQPGYVVWLEAPYGYGKSVLASQWASELESSGWRTLWLTPAGHEPRALLAETLELPSNSPWEVLLDELWRTPTLVVLEDLEALDDHEQLAPLLRDLRGLLLLASRSNLSDSELPRLFTQGRLVRLRTDELAFDRVETGALVGDDATARRLWAVTNGWPLPLHFAALTGDMPEGAALLEGVRTSVTPEEWDEAQIGRASCRERGESAVD